MIVQPAPLPTFLSLPLGTPFRYANGNPVVFYKSGLGVCNLETGEAMTSPADETPCLVVQGAFVEQA